MRGWLITVVVATGFLTFVFTEGWVRADTDEDGASAGATSARERRGDGEALTGGGAARAAGRAQALRSTGRPRRNGAAGRAAGGGDDAPERSDADLMLDALNAQRGETPNAARIEQVSAQVKAESKRRRVIEAAAMWKDPFAEDPDRPIPIHTKASLAKEKESSRRELARAHAETAFAQAAAARAQADSARLKANLARAEAAAARAQAVAARHEAEAARNACADPSAEGKRPVVAKRERVPALQDDDVAPEASPRAARPSPPRRVASHGSGRGRHDSFAPSAHERAQLARRSGGEEQPAGSAGGGDEASPEETPVEEPAVPTQVSQNSAGGGIIVVPITR